MFKNMKIGIRLGLSFSLVLILMIVLILVSLDSMSEIQANIDRIVKVNTVRLALANEMINDVRQVSIALRNILLLKNSEKARETKIAIDEKRKDYDENVKKIEELTPKDDTKGIDLMKSTTCMTG